MKRDGLAIGFRSKIILLCVSIAVAASALHGMFSYRDISQLSRERATEFLGNETRLNGERFLIPLQQMQQDAAVMAGTPPIEALFRILSGRVQTVEGDGLDVWRRRLEVIFRAQLSVRKHYFQIRLIGVQDGGREIVRLDVVDGRLHAIPSGNLQTKGKEPYLRPLLGDDPPQGSYFSNVSRNRENGVVPAGSPWTIRLVHPVFGADGDILGAVVINSEFAALISTSNLRIHPDSVLAVNFGSGDYVSAHAGEGLGAHGDRLAAKRRVLAIGTDEFTHGDGMEVYSAKDWTGIALQMSLPAPDGGHDILVSTAMPTAVLMQSARVTMRNQVVLSVLILAVTTAIASFVGIRLTRPLVTLTERISRRGSLDQLQFDKPPKDEIGQLAQAFGELSNDLTRETRQVRQVFEHAADGLLTADGKGTILNLNPAGYRMFGHPPGSLEGEPISRLIPEGYRAGNLRHMRLLSIVEENPTAAPRRVQALRSDGESFTVEVKLSRVSSERGGLFVAVVHDISARLNAERQQRKLIDELEASNRRLSESNTALEAAKGELERSNAELDKFAYVASHDLRAPLRVIDNASRWLEEDLAEHLDDDTRESMDLLRGRVSRMEQLLRDLLEHSRIGRVRLDDNVIDGPDLVENIWALTAIPDEFRFEVGSEFETISLPQFPIQTVLVNLVSNAVKHHDRPDGKVMLTVTEAEDHFVFEVADDGPGIPAEFHEKVFEMFQTLKPRDDVEGSGMGLAIVKKTVELAGGAIRLASVPGEGSRFRVTWPRIGTAKRREAAA